jgi:5-methyltetrahydrofolate--homocysteine methyltransferase
MKPLLEALAERPLLADGAMGTQLQQAGLEPGGCGELWNVEAPVKILAIQRAYVDAGSDILLTNTFGASRIMLERYEIPEEVEALNRAAVRIARQAFSDAGKSGYVLGDIGPFGGLLEPLGDVAPETAHASFLEQIRILVDAGVDGIIVETQTSLEELGLAIKAAKEAGAPCIIGSVAFDLNQKLGDVRTMMGVKPEQAAQFLESAGAHIAAINCGTGVDIQWASKVIARYHANCHLPLMAQPNAGNPVMEDDRTVYKQTPEEMASGVVALVASGARILGGCCGSTPAHIAALRKTLDAILKESSSHAAPTP